MPAEKSPHDILIAMALEAEASATAAGERAKMQDRAAAASTRPEVSHEAVMAAGKSRDTGAFHLTRAQALRDGARLLEAAVRSAA